MATEARAEEITRRETSGSKALWYGLLAAPLAWITQLVVNYSLEEWFACSPSSTDKGQILGLDVRAFALGVTVALGVVAALGGVVAVRCLRRINNGDDVTSRARWMAYAGILNSVLYLFIIVASVAPPLILPVCEFLP
jgi:H+/Cl- antiporter ClcA